MATSTTTMSMNKVIHCAVRRDLERFRRALEAFPDGDRQRAAGLHRAWVNFDAQLTDHHEGEHEISFPALASMGVDQQTIGTFDAEHSAMAADLAAARSAMAQLEISAGRGDAETAAAAMARLHATTVTHLDHEERVTEPVLTGSEGHPAMKEMARRFSRRSGPAKAGTFFAWMQDGATPAESAALRGSVPGPVLTILAWLFGRRYRTEIAPVWRQ